MADHALPTTASLYTDVVAKFDERLDDLARGLDPATTTPTNVVQDSVRWSSASAKWQKWNGSAWSDLAATYAIAISGNAGSVTGGVYTSGAQTIAGVKTFSDPIVATAATHAYGTNDTKLATTAFVQAALQALYPVGSIYINASDATSPATLFGFGTWVEFGAGRVLVGQNSGDALFDVLQETGGSKDSVVPTHSHTASSGTQSSNHTHSGTTSASGNHTHPLRGAAFAGSSKGFQEGTAQGFMASDNTGSLNYVYNFGTGNAAMYGPGDHTHTITTGTNSVGHTHTITVNSSGVSATNTNLPPYIVVKMWMRTA